MNPEVAKDYQERFTTLIVLPSRREEVEHAITTILRGKARYKAVGIAPWFFIGIVHLLEGGANFATHLHNGDPLHSKTTHVPAGRPLSSPPFTWEESAKDALQYMGLHRVTDWSIPAGILWRLEAYNGFGYRKRNIPSPYLWAGSQHYVSGKFVADGKFSPGAISRQIGGAVILRRMIDQELI